MGGNKVANLAKKGAKAAAKVAAKIAVSIALNILPVILPIIIVVILLIALFNSAGIVSQENERYEGTSFSTTSSGSLAGNSVEEKVWWALLDAGFTPKQTAAAMGHMTGECGGGQRVLRTDTGVGHEGNQNGRGMGGWLDVYSGQDLVAYAESKGMPWEDPDTQIQFLVSWLTWEGDATEYVKRHNSNRGGIPGTGGNGVYYASGAWRDYKETDDVEADLMYLTWAYYVNYGAGSDSSQWDNEYIGKDFRYKNALSFYNEFINKERPTVSSGSKGYWWPVGGKDIEVVDGVEYAPGAPTSTTVWWKPGYRDFSNHSRFHKGTDIAGSGGTDYLIAIGDGTVVKRSSRIDWGNDSAGTGIDSSDTGGLNGYGNSCMVKYADDLYVVYGHMKANTLKVSVGDTVKKGQVLGVMGDSGFASGVHCCFVMLKAQGVTEANTITDTSPYISAENPRQ